MALPMRACDKLVLQGVIAAPATPMHSDGQLNLDAFEPYADHMVKTGISGLFLNGTLGEGASLTVKERKSCLEKWLEVSKGRFSTVIVHVGCSSVPDTKELAAHAEQVGAHAVAVMSPTLFKPSTIQVLVSYLSSIAEMCPTTPFMYYDINILTGVVFNTAEVMRQCKAAIPNFAGIKYSCRELPNYQAAIMESESGRYKLALGTVDEMLLPWLALGAEVPITHSFMGNIHAATKLAFDSGDIKTAQSHQWLALEVGAIKQKYGADVPVSKAILRMMGQNVGPVRLPLQELSEDAYKKLQEEIRGMFGHFLSSA